MTDDLGRRMLELLEQELYAAMGIPKSLFDPPDQPSSAGLTEAALLAVLDRLNTVYDRRRGDLPDKLLVSLDGEHKGLIDKVVRRGTTLVITMALGSVEWEYEDGHRIAWVDVPKVEPSKFSFTHSPMTPDSIIYRTRFGMNIPGSSDDPPTVSSE